MNFNNEDLREKLSDWRTLLAEFLGETRSISRDLKRFWNINQRVNCSLSVLCKSIQDIIQDFNADFSKLDSEVSEAKNKIQELKNANRFLEAKNAELEKRVEKING